MGIVDIMIEQGSGGAKQGDHSAQETGRLHYLY